MNFTDASPPAAVDPSAWNASVPAAYVSQNSHVEVEAARRSDVSPVFSVYPYRAT